jgi:DNA-binding CsgD family transcriptional regulator
MDASENEARHVDATLRQDHPRRGDLLSPREREVLMWLASGLRTAEIAHRMGIETVTVGYHLQRARRKLGARTREQALAIAVKAGLIFP